MASLFPGPERGYNVAHQMHVVVHYLLSILDVDVCMSVSLCVGWVCGV